MRTACKSARTVALAGLALALATGLWAQSTGSSTTPASTPTAQPAPGTGPVGGDTPSATAAKQPTPGTAPAGSGAASTTPTAQPAPGTAPVGGDTTSAKPTKPPAPGTTPVEGDVPAAASNPEKVVEPGSQKVNVKPGSIDDVNAVGNRDIGARGMGNWYSVDTEIKMARCTPWRSRRAQSSLPIRWCWNM